MRFSRLCSIFQVRRISRFRLRKMKRLVIIQRKKKRSSQPQDSLSPLPAVLPPVSRCVASGEQRRVTIASPAVRSGFGPLLGAPKNGQVKDLAS